MAARFRHAHRLHRIRAVADVAAPLAAASKKWGGPVQFDFKYWMESTGLPYDQVVADFYKEISPHDKLFLDGIKVGIFGDSRPYPKSGLA